MADIHSLVTHLEEEEEERLKKSYYVLSDGAIRLTSEGWLLPTNFINIADKIYNFEIKPTDTFVLGFPKSGTMWIQEIAWSLLCNPNLDHPEADKLINERLPVMESELLMGIKGGKIFKRVPLEHRSSDDFFSPLRKSPSSSPRLLKSHLPMRFLPPKMLEVCKVVYVARDFRDVLVSYFHFCSVFDLFRFNGTFDEFVDDFLNDRAFFGPYWSHLREAWEKKDHPNFCFVFYENFKNDVVSEVKKLDKFLGTKRTDKQIQNVVHHTSFVAMKERSQKVAPKDTFDDQFIKDDGFFRKGAVGDWKNKFTPEMEQKINSWMAKNLAQFGENFLYKV